MLCFGGEVEILDRSFSTRGPNTKMMLIVSSRLLVDYVGTRGEGVFCIVLKKTSRLFS